MNGELVSDITCLEVRNRTKDLGALAKHVRMSWYKQ